MPTQFLHRRATLGPNASSRPNANAVYVDSDNDIVTYTTGATGTTEEQLVSRTLAQTLTAKTLTTPIVNSGAGVDATGPEIDRVADTSARLIAGGATLTVTQALHDGKIILLNTASGTTATLPAATATGSKYTFIVSVVPTSNQHRITVVGNDSFRGTAVFETDNAADGAVAFVTAADTDQVNLNGTTTGGLSIGDSIEVVDILTDIYSIRIQASSSGTEATPFTTGQVT